MKAHIIGLAIAALAPAQPASAAPATVWQTFVSRGGWSIDYPRGWEASACHLCSDPTEPGLFVSFSTPGDNDNDFLMVEPLADRPANRTVAQWFDEIAVTADQNRVLEKRPGVINGRFAMTVRYVYANHRLYDVTYVIDGVRTFELGGLAPVGSPGLPRLRHMISTFNPRPVAPLP